jgi:GNAT superfamily N-acetyltransferase
MSTDATAALALTIRAATTDDIAALVPMVNAAYRVAEGHVFPTTDRVHRTDAMRRMEGTLVAFVGDALAGCVRVEIEPPAAHFGLLTTDLDMQRRGIASALVAHVERLARDAGCTVMRIEVVKEGGRVPFYERRGYVVTRETSGQEWNGGEDWGAIAPWHMVDMEKDLR